MPTPLVMPKLGLTMREGSVVEWRCSEGEPVRQGSVVVVIESEKVEFEVEAPSDQVVRKQVVAAGDTVPCGDVLAVLTETADEELDLDAFLASLEQERAAAKTRARPERRERRERAPRADGRHAASPRAKRLARTEGVNLERVAGTGPDGRITEQDVRDAVEALGPRVTLGDARIGYSDEGTGEPAAVLLVGFGLDRSAWNPQLRALAEQRRVIAPDPRGAGASSDPGETLGLEALAADVVELLGSLEIERADLVGTSLGCAVALEVALRAPERVQRLVLVSPAVEPDARLLAALGSIASVARSGDVDARVSAMLPWFFGRAFLGDEARLARAHAALAQIAQRVPVRTLERQRRALADWLGTRRSDIAKLEHETLVLVGSDDALTPLEHARAVVDALPSARLCVLDGVGHAPMVEAPERLESLLSEFLAR
jgi:pimeloyl-ACP methyl ester carboxylesterase